MSTTCACAAQRRLPSGVFEFVDRGSEDERRRRATIAPVRADQAAPPRPGRCLRPHLATTLFGKPSQHADGDRADRSGGPVWHEGELELAKAAAEAKIPFTLATGAMTSMEKIAKEAGPAWAASVVPALCVEAARAVLSAYRARPPQWLRGSDRYCRYHRAAEPGVQHA